jgi:hypothetical protein
VSVLRIILYEWRQESVVFLIIFDWIQTAFVGSHAGMNQKLKMHTAGIRGEITRSLD